MIKFRFVVSFFILFSIVFVTPKVSAINVGDPCNPNTDNPKSYLSILPTWYKYIDDGRYDVQGRCMPHFDDESGTTFDFKKIPLIGLAIIDILLRLSGIIAVFMIVYSGFKYIFSQGNPESTKAAKSTIQNAIIGIVIVTSSIAVIQFLARLLQK